MKMEVFLKSAVDSIERRFVSGNLDFELSDDIKNLYKIVLKLFPNELNNFMKKNDLTSLIDNINKKSYMLLDEISYFKIDKLGNKIIISFDGEVIEKELFPLDRMFDENKKLKNLSKEEKFLTSSIFLQDDIFKNLQISKTVFNLYYNKHFS